MQSLSSFLQAHNTPSDIAAILNGLMTSCVDISNKLQQGALAGILGCAGEENIQGETQKKLDVISNDIIKDQLASMSMVKGMASEEED
jgi:fructose-1,6-bisphosphatase I